MREIMLIVHFIGLAMALGTAFTYFFLNRASAKMPNDEGHAFMIKTRPVSLMGNIGLILSFISGGYLMTPYWKLLGEMPLVITKLVLFVALGALFGIIGSNLKKAKSADQPGPFLTKVKSLGNIGVLLALAIVILAVLSFH